MNVRMRIDCFWLVALPTGQPVGMEIYLAHAVVGFFGLLLFSVSLFAWSKRRHVGLLLVSSAFLIFFLKQVFWLLSERYNFFSSIDMILVLADLVVLGLFFMAIVPRPRKQLE